MGRWLSREKHFMYKLGSLSVVSTVRKHRKNQLWWMHLSSSPSVRTWEVEVTLTSVPAHHMHAWYMLPLPTQVSQHEIQNLGENYTFAAVSGFGLSGAC